MIRTSLILSVCLPLLGFAQNGQVIVNSAASTGAGVSAEALATASGSGLASQTAAAQSAPWPTSLGGITVDVQDSGSMSRPAGLLFVSPGQINFQIPAGTALGAATVTINNGGAKLTTMVQIQPVAPALFVLNDLLVPAATAVRVFIPRQDQSAVPVFRCVDTPGSCRLLPIDPGVDAPVYLSFYATGIRGRSSLSNVSVKMGSATVAATYAGAQGQFPGLDQVNVPLPLSLRSAGEVMVTVTVDGMTSNPVKINVM